MEMCCWCETVEMWWCGVDGGKQQKCGAGGKQWKCGDGGDVGNNRNLVVVMVAMVGNNGNVLLE